MCGIAGIVVPPGEVVQAALLAKMTRTLSRRGPDDEGYYLDEKGGCGLGHRRLSIIDLSGGRQPLASSDQNIQLVANGEIYNYQGLRFELQKLGHHFSTNSDCEVLVQGYVAWGPGMVERIDGMFAFALWDARNRRLLLGRDRQGKKPLYYGFIGPHKSTLIFGSELKALLAHPGLERRVSPSGLASYLTFECVPEDQAIYEGVSKVLPGQLVTYDRDQSRREAFTYWKMSFSGGAERGVPDLARWSEDQISEELRARIRAATRARLMSEVPLGVFLSGGIDSSTIAAAMTQEIPAKNVKTFSITFDDPSFDEGPQARRMAEHLGTDHHEERLSPDKMLAILPSVADFMCEPIGDASIIPTYLLSLFARRSVTVALGGDGGDELFLGYPTFQAEQVAERLDRHLTLSARARLSRAALSFARRLPVSRKNFSFDFKLKRFAQGMGWPAELRHQAWLGSFLPDELQDLLVPDLAAGALAKSPFALVSDLARSVPFRDPLDRAVLQYARLYLASCVLVKVDRASMACGLEVRAPLLDTAVVDFVCALPSHYKVRGFTTKYILKRAVRPWLPAEIIDRPKKGFGVPVAEWLRGPLRDMARSLLDPRRLSDQGYFRHQVVSRLLEEHERGQADHRKPLWTLLAFQLWYDRHGPRASAVEAARAPSYEEPPSNVVLRC